MEGTLSASDVALLMFAGLAGLTFILVSIAKALEIKEHFHKKQQQVGIIDVTPERWGQIKENIEDVLETGISDLMAAGKWTKEEGADVKQKLANVFELKGLIPRGHQTLRERMIESLSKLGKLPEKFRQAPAPPQVQKVKSVKTLKTIFGQQDQPAS